MKLRYLFFFVSVMVFGCKQESSVSVNGELVDLYVELVLLNEEYKLPSSGLSQEQYQQKIRETLQKHNTTREQFTTEIQALSNNRETFRQFYDSVSKRLQEHRGKS